jgi:hypothetical protein
MWYGITLTLGLVLLGFGGYTFKKSIDFIRKGSRVPASVVELESYKDSEGDVLYRPIFQYTFAGEKFKYTHEVASKPSSWTVGEETHFVIDPNDPNKPILLTYFGAFGWSVVLITIALPLIFIGAGYFWADHFIQKIITTP